MGAGREQRPPTSEMFVLSRSLAVNDFLRGGSWPGTQGAQGVPRTAGQLVCWLPWALESTSPCSGALLRAPSLQAARERGSFLFPASPILPGGDLAPWEVGSPALAGWDGSASLGRGVGSAASRVGECQWLLLSTSEQPGMGHVPTGTCWKPAWQPIATAGVWGCGNGSEGGGLGESCTRGCRKGSGDSSRTCHHPCQDTQGQELPVPDPGAPEVAKQPLGQV